MPVQAKTDAPKVGPQAKVTLLESYSEIMKHEPSAYIALIRITSMLSLSNQSDRQQDLVQQKIKEEKEIMESIKTQRRMHPACMSTCTHITRYFSNSHMCADPCSDWSELMSVEELAKGIRYTEPIKTSWTPPRKILARPQHVNDAIRKRWNILVEGACCGGL